MLKLILKETNMTSVETISQIEVVEQPAKPKPVEPSRPRTVTAKADTRSKRNLMRASSMREPVINTAYNE